VEIASEGYLGFTDRKKEIIVLSGGKNISRANLETGLMADFCVAQACIIGDPASASPRLSCPTSSNSSASSGALGSPGRLETITNDIRVRDFPQQRLCEFNRSHSDVEVISAFRLIPAAFMQENGELAPLR